MHGVIGLHVDALLDKKFKTIQHNTYTWIVLPKRPIIFITLIGLPKGNHQAYQMHVGEKSST